ncbi:MAG: N-acetylmuramic acid 6-phosphate etherase [Planctomycetota bacterium]
MSAGGQAHDARAEREAHATGARDFLPTEQPNVRARELDALSTADAFDVANAEDQTVAHAVARAKSAIVAAIDLVADRLHSGGRYFTVGAGTSGRLAVLDAAELPPTFQSEPSQVQAVIAGGSAALVTAVEGAEDDRAAGAREIDAREIGSRDVVLGLSAGGTTPFVHAALARAKSRGAATIFFACVPADAVRDDADLSIRVVTGPEVVSGSTRLKAGTATKLVLNTISTLAMAKLGKVYGPWMIDVNARGNAKLWQRAVSLVERLTDLARADAELRLREADGRAKVAVAMERLHVGADEARARLSAAGGSLRRALAAGSPW